MFPEFAAYFAEGAELEGISWEAHRVTTVDGYQKILFRIVGNDIAPNFKPRRQPVLLTHGNMSNAMLWLVGSQTGKTRDEYAEEIETMLKEKIDTEDPDRKLWLQSIKDASETRWSELATEWDMDIESLITSAPDSTLDE